jgi:4-hydroxy-tetrahydrodipicolinate synthase
MEAHNRPRGVLAAILTPVGRDLAPDHARLIAHARWLLANGCDGLNVLGTTGEAASFSTAQRVALMEALAGSGLPLDAMLVGTGAAALADATVLTRTAIELGFGGALVIPPFYYKDVPDDGTFAFYSELIERSGGAALRLYLYNFPKMSGVLISPELTGRLIEAFGTTIAGLKDSSGDMTYAAALHRAYPSLDIFPSSEAVLAECRRSGYAGCISASANVTAPYCATVWRGDPGDEAPQVHVAALRAAIASVPLIPALRFLVSELHHDADWLRAMPPLASLAESERATLLGRLRAAGYAAPSGALA